MEIQKRRRMFAPARLGLALLAAAAALGALATAVWATPGDLDPSFGSGGIVVTDLGSREDDGGAIAIQADGKIVVVGMTERSLWDTSLIMSRRESDGEADSTFGIAGVVTTSVSGYASPTSNAATQARCRCIGLSPTTAQTLIRWSWSCAIPTLSYITPWT